MEGTTMTPDALSALASKVEREWGSYGYRFETVEPIGWTGGALGRVAHSDGSRFVVVADRHGNTAHGDTDAQAVAALTATTDRERNLTAWAAAE